MPETWKIDRPPFCIRVDIPSRVKLVL